MSVYVVVSLLVLFLDATHAQVHPDNTISNVKVPEPTNNEQVYPFNPQQEKAPKFPEEQQNRSCWNDNVVPYYIGPGFDESQRKYIQEKIDLLHGATCIRWINLAKNPGNFSDLAIFQKVSSGNCRVTWEKQHNNSYVVYMKLLDRCFEQHWVLHEMMHVMGFHNEQQRADRNCYVHIHINAVNFTEYRLMRHDDWIERYPYDKFSVMHARTNFLIQGRDERWLDSYDPLGNPEGLLSYLDLNKIRYKYCGGRHFCETSPNTCNDNDHAKKVQNCANYTPWHG